MRPTLRHSRARFRSTSTSSSETPASPARCRIDRYSVEDPFENHPLFKSEEQARLEETLDGVDAQESSSAALPWPGEGDEPESEPEPAEGAALDEGLWGRSRDFDWGE